MKTITLDFWISTEGSMPLIFVLSLVYRHANWLFPNFQVDYRS